MSELVESIQTRGDNGAITDEEIFAAHSAASSRRSDLAAGNPARPVDRLHAGCGEGKPGDRRRPTLAARYTWTGRLVAVISDGTAVLGLGDIGPAASLPVMEGKAALFKKFAGLDSIPIVLDTKDVDEIVETIVRLRPRFGAVNLEDISAPRCFEIERRVIEALDCPVMHDDQHGTAIVVLAALAVRRRSRAARCPACGSSSPAPARRVSRARTSCSPRDPGYHGAGLAGHRARGPRRPERRKTIWPREPTRAG